MEIAVSSNALSVARDFAVAAGVTHAAVTVAVHEQGLAFQGKVQARASGRPGPRAQTGDYRRSISEQTTSSPTRVTSEVGTNAVQGRRLEFGFWGLVDSLGRLFYQPAYPHFGPAADEMEQAFPDAVEAAAFAAIVGRR